MSSSGRNLASDLFVSVSKYGTVNAADSTAAIAAALTDAGTVVSANGPRAHDGTLGPAARAVYFPAGVWNTTAQVIAPRGVSVVLAEGAVIRATATINGALLATSATPWQGQMISGGTLDCNLLAQDGLFIRNGQYSKIRDLHIDDPTRHGVILGDTGLSASCFELKLDNVTARRRTGQALVAGSRGFSIEKCSDSVLFQCVGVSFETGFYEASGDNRKAFCHAWGFPGAYPKWAFDDTTGSHSHYIGCVADSPTVAGFRVRVGYASITESSVFLAGDQADNTVVGVSLDAGATNFTGVNNRFQGANAGVRLAADYVGADTGWKSTSTITGQTTAFTVTPLPTRNTFPAYSTAGQLVDKTFFVAGSSANLTKVQIYWPVPVQVDSIIIRASSGTGTQFQVWQGGTQLTATFNQGDNAPLFNPYTSTVPVTLAANAGLYLTVPTAGTGADFTVVVKAFQNG